MKRRSALIVRFLQRNAGHALAIWTVFFLLVSALRIAAAPVSVHSPSDLGELVLPYALIALAPLAGFHLAERAFPNGTLIAQPGIRFSLFGNWRRISVTEAHANPLFGPAGFMASMLIGLLLNVVVRGLEFLAGVPALNSHAPEWGQALFHLMAADLAVMGFFYMICFVMALRSVAWFPRMLLFSWLLDVSLQVLIARQIGATAGLPETVALPLQGLLAGNIDKVLISSAVWLPYLILSDRVNVTYRQRIGRKRPNHSG